MKVPTEVKQLLRAIEAKSLKYAKDEAFKNSAPTGHVMLQEPGMTKVLLVGSSQSLFPMRITFPVRAMILKTSFLVYYRLSAASIDLMNFLRRHASSREWSMADVRTVTIAARKHCVVIVRRLHELNSEYLLEDAHGRAEIALDVATL